MKTKFCRSNTWFKFFFFSFSFIIPTFFLYLFIFSVSGITRCNSKLLDSLADKYSQAWVSLTRKLDSLHVFYVTLSVTTSVLRMGFCFCAVNSILNDKCFFNFIFNFIFHFFTFHFSLFTFLTSRNHNPSSIYGKNQQVLNYKSI